MACGVTQRARLDYSSDELYASVCSYSSTRFLLSMATQNNMLLFQTDIQGAYLESYLDDEIYMDIPKGISTHSDHYCKLVCGLYGCKQSGWAWSQCFKHFMSTDPTYNMNFTTMTGEPNLYKRSILIDNKLERVFVGQYVDDCLIAASSPQLPSIGSTIIIHLKARFTLPGQPEKLRLHHQRRPWSDYFSPCKSLMTNLQASSPSIKAEPLKLSLEIKVQTGHLAPYSPTPSSHEHLAQT